MFGPVAERLAGLCALLLGWRPAEFWSATPAELASILGICAGIDGADGMDGAALARLKETCGDG